MFARSYIRREMTPLHHRRYLWFRNFSTIPKSDRKEDVEREDPTEIHAGQIASRAEWNAWREYEKDMNWSQYIRCRAIFSLIAVRNSFIDGSVRRGLTAMAVYAASAEFLHDFFHDSHFIHNLLGTIGTQHAVGFIALSHLSEHLKEWLEKSELPLHHASKRTRLEILRIFAGSHKHHWPRHVQRYNKYWDKHRGHLGCFLQVSIQEEVRKADKKTSEHDSQTSPKL